MSDEDREWWIARWEIQQEKCPRCGNPRSMCSDPEREWFPQRVTCYAERARLAGEALFAKAHEKAPYTDDAGSWAKERSAEHPYHFADGVTIWAADTDLDPDDDFLAG